jgi:hypothetical protein
MLPSEDAVDFQPKSVVLIVFSSTVSVAIDGMLFLAGSRLLLLHVRESVLFYLKGSIGRWSQTQCCFCKTLRLLHADTYMNWWLQMCACCTMHEHIQQYICMLDQTGKHVWVL